MKTHAHRRRLCRGGGGPFWTRGYKNYSICQCARCTLRRERWKQYQEAQQVKPIVPRPMFRTRPLRSEPGKWGKHVKQIIERSKET